MEFHVSNFVDDFEIRNSINERAVLNVAVETAYIGWGKLEINSSVGKSQLRIDSETYKYGLGDHVQSLHTLYFPASVTKFSAVVGLQRGMHFFSKMVFIVEDENGVELGRSPELDRQSPPFLLEVDVPHCRALRLRALDCNLPSDEPGLMSPQGNANWCDLQITLAEGRSYRGDMLKFSERPGFFSFDYDGKPVCFAKTDMQELENNEQLHRWQCEYSVEDGTLTLKIIFTRFRDFPVVEWHPYLLNRSDRPSGIVSNFKPLHFTLAVPDVSTGYMENEHNFMMLHPQNDVRIRRLLGSKNLQSDFCEDNVILRDRYNANTLCMDTDEGRSSAAWMPFFGVDISDTEGLNFGIGWSGAWTADMQHTGDALLIRAGMKRTHFRVLPGEEFRQVSIFVHNRVNMDVEEGQNELRRFILAHHSPHNADGTVMKTPLPVSAWGGDPTEAMLKTIDIVHGQGFKLDTFWVDAGWYGKDRPVATSEFEASDWPMFVGDWRVNHFIHPQGLRPVSEAAHRAGMKFLLWVEIERVRQETPMATEHPEWLLPDKEVAGNLLLNLGIPEARQWAIDTIDRLVEEEHIDYYRQDFNFNTLEIWNAADTEERQGVTEMLFIDGLYRFWDTLREHHPDMLIDNCASGGRRIDFETMSRSICLWRCDLLGRPWFDCSEVNQIQINNLSRWVPLHAGGICKIEHDDYAYISGACPGVLCGIFRVKPDMDMEWYRQIHTLAVRMSQFAGGDMYLLSESPEQRNRIYACQFHSPEQDEGFFEVFRRPTGTENSICLSLHRIDPEAAYELDWYKGEKTQLSGAELMSLVVEMPQPRSVKVCFYKRLS